MSWVFIAAGLSNLTAVPIFSRFFTNEAIAAADPAVMSNFGLVIIMVWGLAYLSVSKHFASVRWLVGVFAIEKLAYGIVWLRWLSQNSLSDVYQQDTMAGVFYSIYGLNDFVFFVLFLLIFRRLK